MSNCELWIYIKENYFFILKFRSNISLNVQEILWNSIYVCEVHYNHSISSVVTKTKCAHDHNACGCDQNICTCREKPEGLNNRHRQ